MKREKNTREKLFFGEFFVMNSISALLCEFNPLHTGHKYILEKLRENGDIAVCIMSGNFVQRGESAICDKYTRAEAALECGADLVLELPFPWCAAPAEFFALGGISIAEKIGASRIVFGSECGDTELIKKAASLCDSEEFNNAVKEEYKADVGYARARENAAKRIMPEASSVFSSSNDLLATEYIRCASKTGYRPLFEAVGRHREEGYLSASEIRKMILSGNAAGACGKTHTDPRQIEREALAPSKLFDIEHVIFRLKKNDASSFDSQSGILSRIASAASKARNGREMFAYAATKKYTDARIRRAALMSVLSVGADSLSVSPRFTVLLGARERGLGLLSAYKNDMTIVTKPSCINSDDELTLKQYEKQRQADALYALCKGEEASYYLKKSPVIL